MPDPNNVKIQIVVEFIGPLAWLGRFLERRGWLHVAVKASAVPKDPPPAGGIIRPAFTPPLDSRTSRFP